MNHRWKCRWEMENRHSRLLSVDRRQSRQSDRRKTVVSRALKVDFEFLFSFTYIICFPFVLFSLSLPCQDSRRDDTAVSSRTFARFKWPDHPALHDPRRFTSRSAGNFRSPSVSFWTARQRSSDKTLAIHLETVQLRRKKREEKNKRLYETVSPFTNEYFRMFSLPC